MDPVASWTARRLIAVLGALAIVMVLVPATFAAPEDGDQEPPPLEPVGKVQFREASGELLSPRITPTIHGVDPELGLLVAGIDPVNGPNELYLVDTGRVEQVGVVELSGTPLDAGHHAVLIDSTQHRVFVPGANPGLFGEQTGIRKIGIVDLTGDEETIVRDIPPAPDDAVAGVSRRAIGAMSYDPESDVLYLLTGAEGGAGAARHLVRIYALDVPTLVEGESDPVLWSYGLGEMCQANLGFLGLTNDARHLYLPCAADSLVGLSQFEIPVSPGMHGIVRIELDQGQDRTDTSGFRTEFFPFAGNLNTGKATGNDGADLVFVATASAGDQKLFVFDSVHGAWTGAVKLFEGNTLRTGADPESGRIYQGDDSGRLVITEGDRIAVPNGRRVRLDFVAVGDAGQIPVVDPVTRRVFLKGPFSVCPDRDRTDCPFGEREDGSSHLRAYQDNIPPAPPPEPFDPDDATEDVPERAGETVSTLSGNAEAFGARYTFAGGTGSHRAANPAGLVDDSVNPLVRGAPVGPGTRDLLLGQAIGANLAASSFGSPQVGASAAGLVPGGQTVNDLRANSNVRCAASRLATRPNSAIGTINNIADEDSGSDGPFPLVPDPGCFEESGDEQLDRNTDGLSWPGEFPEELRGHVSLCRVFGGDSEEESKPGSAVNCDPTVPKVESVGSFTASASDAPFSVADAESVASVVRDGERGTVARAEAVARGVNVLGIIRIGEIRTVAEAAAHGRPGTASTTLRREAYQVAIGPPGEEPAFTCGFGEEPCDLHQVAEAINEHLQPRIKATVPPQATNYDEDADFESPDAEISNATGGGAKATVEIDPYHFQSNRNINTIGQFEVPALQIVAYDDHKEASRHILQLGAVALDANYTVSELPSFDFPLPPPGGGDVGSPGTDGGDGGLDLDLPVQQQRAIQVPPFEPLGDAATSDQDLTSADPVTDLGGTDPSTSDGTPGAPVVPSQPAGPVSSGPAPSLSTQSGPATGGGGAQAPEVAVPAGEGEQPPLASAPTQQSGPGGLTLTQQSIGETAPMAAMWLMIALPIYLAVRRRGLIDATRR